VILDLIAEAKAAGLPAEQACVVLSLSPRTVQRWKAPAAAGKAAAPTVARRRPYNALTAGEAARVIALIQSAKHADASCRELALALQNAPEPTFVSHVTVWEYERALNCNGPRGRQAFQGRGRSAPDTAWVDGPNQLWDWDGRPFGRLVNISLDMTHHQGWVS
jgi:putative transposase